MNNKKTGLSASLALCCLGALADAKLLAGRAAPPRRFLAPSRRSAPAAPEQYVLLGPEDSGTNLVEALINANWPGEFASTESKRGLWKHCNSGAADIYRLLNESLPQELDQTAAIIEVRNPISLAVGWRKAPYDMYRCALRPYELMGLPCRAPLRARTLPAEGYWDDRWEYLMLFNSTMDVFNNYVAQYRQLEKDGRFRAVIVLNYEDVVLDQEAAVRRLAAALGRPVPERIRPVTRPAKPHGKPLTAGEALEKLRSRSYLEELGPWALPTLCKGIDRGLLSPEVPWMSRLGELITEDCGAAAAAAAAA